MSRMYDIVVFGATGFTGRLVCEHLARRFPTGAAKSLRWAMAGRSAAKLAEVRAANPALADVPIIIADATNAASLDAAVASTKVVLSTVGPFALHGEPLVRACATAGTHYCDITGEASWVRTMIDRYADTARASGALLVSFCGFDSIPSDLSVLAASNALGGDPMGETTLYVTLMRGGMSGGTLASILNMVEGPSSLRRLGMDPYCLNAPPAWRGKDRGGLGGVRWAPDVARWTYPWLMGSVNSQVVRWTNSLLGVRYGPAFSYKEVAADAGGFVATVVRVAALAVAGIMVLLPFTRPILRRLLPAGTGPSRAQMERGKAEVTVVARTAPPARPRVARVVCTLPKDPGYLFTSVMLGESAVALSALPATRGSGGFGSPAAVLGMKLVELLTAQGMTLTATTEWVGKF